MPTETAARPRLFVWSAIAKRELGLNTVVQGEFGVLTATNEDEVRGAALRAVMDKWPGYSVAFVSVGEVPPALIEEAGYVRR